MNDLKELKRMLDDAPNWEKGTLDIFLSVMHEVVCALHSKTGGGVLFTDITGEGEMNIHLIGNQDHTPQMLLAAPSVYRSHFNVPDGASLQ